MERLVLVARLKPGTYARAQELASKEVPAGRGQARLGGTNFLSPSEVVFVIEGEDAELHAREWFDDPVLSTAFASWLPLLDGPLHAVREVGTWGQRNAS
jgi:hypothetical protein